MEERQTRVGTVVSVNGSRLECILDYQPDETPGAGSHIQIGHLVKIPRPDLAIFGIVGSMSIKNPSSPPSPSDTRIVEIDLMGEADVMGTGGKLAFRRGVSAHPVLGEAIVAATSSDLAQIYAKPSDETVSIGTLHQDSSLPAYVITNDLLAKHFAILGTTGSGKSCSLAVILKAVLDASPQGHMVLLDPHDEYSRVFNHRAEVITPETLQFPYWLLNFEELSSVLCSKNETAYDHEAAVLKQAVLQAKRDFLAQRGEDMPITVDTPTPYRLTRIIEVLRDEMGRLGKPTDELPYLRILSRIDTLSRDPRYSFMFSGLVINDNMAEVISSILRIPVDDKPVTIINLVGVPAEIVDVMVSLICRMVFDFAQWSEADTAVPVLLVCEEAHRYIPKDPEAGFSPTRKAVARIAKEGRKYGVSLGLVTQRPSEVSEAILSQMNTLFALRMSNDRDQEFVQHALPENAAGLLRALPSLKTQEAVVVGEGVPLPMRVRFNDLDAAHRPRSDTAEFALAWRHGEANLAQVAKTVERWRRQVRR